MAAGSVLGNPLAPTDHRWQQSDFSDLARAGATSPICGGLKFKPRDDECSPGSSRAELLLLIVRASASSANSATIKVRRLPPAASVKNSVIILIANAVSCSR
jgi:hypothetical protein